MPEITLEKFEEVSVGGIRLDVGGPYDLVIHEKPELVDMETDKPYMQLRVKCLSGPDQEDPNNSGTNSPVGLVVAQRVYLNAKFIVKRYLIATGLLTREDTESPMAKGKFNTDMLFNKKFKGMIKAEMYDGKERRNVEAIIDE